MNLAIDIGNSFTKFAVFEKETLVEVSSTNQDIRNFLEAISVRFNFSAAILSTVKKLTPAFEQVFISIAPKSIIATPELKMPIRILYQTPETLGMDRLAAAVGASAHFPDENVLIVDAGSCITIDILTKEGFYLGGSISPGIHQRLRALHEFNGNLPMLPPEFPESFTGRTTRESILTGIMNGTVFEVKGFIEEYSSIYDGLIVVLTGGDFAFFERNLKIKTFALPDLVLTGLNKILIHNAETA